jgi:starvation-inducible DNA-binding protein
MKRAMATRIMYVIASGATDRELLASGLAKVLADTHGLYAKTWRFHRDVGRDASIGLRLLLHQQGNDLACATDRIVERMRFLGLPAQGWRPSLWKPPMHHGPAWSAQEMIRCLAERHEAVARRINGVLQLAATDRATCDLLRQRIKAHEKAAWVLAEMGIAALIGEFFHPRRPPTRPRPLGPHGSAAPRAADSTFSRKARSPRWP